MMRNTGVADLHIICGARKGCILTLMTCPIPSVNSKGCPRSTEESNFVPSARVPCRVTVKCQWSHLKAEHFPEALST